MEFLIVTGLSGGGKTQAANFLEDLDYYCVDNMPSALLVPFAEFCLASQGRFERVALVTDIRTQNNFEELFRSLEKLRTMDCTVRILFMEAPVPVIVRRYKESRRRHPLARQGRTIQEAVQQEIQLMQSVRDRADYILNTGSTTLGQLHKEICRLFVEDGKQSMPVNIMAFGYKFGIPLEADLVFDVRFLPNPYYIEEMRSLTGMDDAVYHYVMDPPEAQDFMGRFLGMIDYLLPRYEEEGKQSLTIAIGCTGGRHRSVAVARALNDHLVAQGQNARLVRRDDGRTADN